jgi:class 3 adenylate cyclase
MGVGVSSGVGVGDGVIVGVGITGEGVNVGVGAGVGVPVDVASRLTSTAAASCQVLAVVAGRSEAANLIQKFTESPSTPPSFCAVAGSSGGISKRYTDAPS